MDLKRTSIFLSLILRHKPYVIGIELDDNGWANVQDLINGVNQTGRYTLDMPTLEEIVNSDEKKRYAFNKDKTRIRAQQGHSIKIDANLIESEPPEILWHGTCTKNIDSINSIGLVKQTRLYVHLSDNPQTAVKIGSRHGKPVVFAVLAGEMYQLGYKFYLSRNGIWMTEKVPPEFLRM